MQIGTGHKLINYGKGLLAHVFQLGNGTIIITIYCNAIKLPRLMFVVRNQDDTKVLSTGKLIGHLVLRLKSSFTILNKEIKICTKLSL